MDLLVNDLSLHGQFASLESFKASIRAVFRARQVAKQYGRDVYCHRRLVSRTVMEDWPLARAAQGLPVDQRRVVLSWLTKHGPFWEDRREHHGDDWYECDGTIVTDCAPGEAAHSCLHGLDRGLVSFVPSDFETNPLPVELVEDDTKRTRIDVPNYGDPDTLRKALNAAPPPLTSWSALQDLATTRFNELVFSPDAFEPLGSQPFKAGAAQHLFVLLQVLHDLRSAVDDNGQRTAAGQEIYQRHFTGGKAWFSDSSATEKHQFHQALSFRHPDDPGQTLFCPWHGKEKSRQLRIHFTWPVSADTSLRVVYVGPKLTRK